jgi:hypothetical protein
LVYLLAELCQILKCLPPDARGRILSLTASPGRPSAINRAPFTEPARRRQKEDRVIEQLAVIPKM